MGDVYAIIESSSGICEIRAATDEELARKLKKVADKWCELFDTYPACPDTPNDEGEVE